MCGIRTVVSTGVLCVTALTLWPSALAQQPPPSVTGGLRNPDANTSAASPSTGSLKLPSSRQAVPNRLTLPEVDSPQGKLDAAGSGAPRQIGFGREIPPEVARDVEPANLLWSPAGAGSVAALSVTSRGAAAIRLGLVVRHLPQGTELRFFSPDPAARVFGPFSPSEIDALISEREDGPGGLFWSPVLEGDTAGLEIFVPEAAVAPEVALRVAYVSHLVDSPMVSRESAGPKAAAPCEIDIACHSSSWGSTAQAVARMVFTTGGRTYLCSGTLLNDRSSTRTPYFLTANHCLSTNSVAATLNTYWAYERSSCGGTAVLDWQQLTRGAAVLATDSTIDFTFLRLNEPAPAGATFAGWDAGPISPGRGVAGIHHPAGDPKKISFGAADGISCSGCEVGGWGSFLQVTWSQGLTEGGSSGSGLFTADEQRLVGVLSGGWAPVCGGQNRDWYGRFELIYSQVSAWLESGTRIMSLSGNVTFGDTQPGGIAQGVLTISNTGSSALTVSSITFPAGFTGDWSSGTVEAGGSRAVTVSFTPSQQAVYSGPITVHANQTAGTNTVTASGAGRVLVSTLPFRTAAADFDGDGKADLSVWRAPTGMWYALRSSNESVLAREWGGSEDFPVPGDYDGDGRTDVAFWRPSTGVWHVLRSSDGSVLTRQWGSGAPPYFDQPVPGDYDGDGRSDFAVWRPWTGAWYVNRSSDGAGETRHWGHGYAPHYDLPVAGDFDGDGRADAAVWRRSTGVWYVVYSADRTIATEQWGRGDAPYYDIPVLGDYDGDGRTDIAVWRPSTGSWYVMSSLTGLAATHQWGAGRAPHWDLPVPGDYDGDGTTDLAVWRPGTGVWHVIRSSDGTAAGSAWGAGHSPYFDVPLPAGGSR